MHCKTHGEIIPHKSWGNIYDKDGKEVSVLHVECPKCMRDKRKEEAKIIEESELK